MFLKKSYCFLVFLSLFLSIQLFCSSNIQNDKDKIVVSKKSIITTNRALFGGAVFASVFLFLWWQGYIKLSFNSSADSDDDGCELTDSGNDQEEEIKDVGIIDIENQEENAKATYYQKQFIKKSRQWLDYENSRMESIDSLMQKIYDELFKNNSEFIINTLIPDLKGLLEKGYYLTDGQIDTWFVDEFLKIIYEMVPNSQQQTTYFPITEMGFSYNNPQNFKAILAVLNCFYPTEFLLSKDCLMTYGYDNTFAHIAYKIYSDVEKLNFNEDEKDIEWLRNMLFFANNAYYGNNNHTILFDFLFTEENLQKEWLQKLIKKKGIVHLDIIWEILNKKDDGKRNTILNTLKGINNSFEIALENFANYDKPIEIYEKKFNNNLYMGIVVSMNYFFFTSHDKFSQLLYKLMQKQETFNDYMESIFNAPFFNEEKNLFFDFVKHEYGYEHEIRNEKNVLSYILKFKNNFDFIINTTPGRVAWSESHINEKKRDNDFITKYTTIRENTLLLLRWYDIYSAINLYKDENSGFYENKQYLGKIFNENLRHYKSDFTRQSQFRDNLKNSVTHKNTNDIINVSSAYHLFINFQDDYERYHKDDTVEHKGCFFSKNKDWISENEICKFISEELFDNKTLQL